MEAGQPLGLKPCGLGARDSLRFEAKMPLYGQEIGPDITPIEAGLGWAVALDAPGKESMIGRDALLKVKLQGPRPQAGRLRDDRARHRLATTTRSPQPAQVVGHVTTGMYSPTLAKNIGLGFVPGRSGQEGQRVRGHCSRQEPEGCGRRHAVLQAQRH